MAPRLSSRSINQADSHLRMKWDQTVVKLKSHYWGLWDVHQVEQHLHPKSASELHLPSGSVTVGLQVYRELIGDCKVRGMSLAVCCHRQ
jgi:hypothetical protein